MANTKLVNDKENVMNDLDGEFCVKTGLYFPDGCPVEECPDITECPYAPDEIELNSP